MPHPTSIITSAKQLTPLQQVLALTIICLLLQYSINFLTVLNAFPDMFGKSVNSIIQNHTFLIPGVLAIVGTWFYEGSEGVRRIFRPYRTVPLNPLWWLFATLALLPLLVLALHADDFLYQRTDDWGVQLPTWEAILSGTPKFVKVAICDELFWIGFCYPRLIHAGMTPFNAGIVIGALWGLDYLPFIATDFFVTPGLSAASLLLGWVALAPTYIWLYHKTRSALLIVYFNLVMQFSYGCIPIQPNAMDTNSGMAMANLFTLILGIILWRYFSHGRSYNLDFLKHKHTTREPLINSL